MLSASIAPGVPTPGMVDPLEAESHGSARGASPLNRIATTPGDGAVLTASNAPDAVIIRLDSATLRDWLDGGVTLYRIEGDGAATPLFNPESPPIASRADGAVTIPLDQPLGPGRYRVVLAGGEISFSRLIWDGSWNYREDQTLAEFEVVADRGAFDSALDAGTVGTALQRFNGSLAASGDRALYKIALGADQALWRLGLQLDAGRIGSDLWANLTVYNAQGDIVASSEGRRGFASAADDPHLFVGLRPGTYYVGVSMAEGSRRSGAYRLAVVADPAAEPTRVVGFALDWSRGAPVGFTIAFSDAIAPEALEATAAPLFAVDELGEIHPAHLTAADGGLRRLSFTFDSPLPSGRYRLVLAGEGGLVDLIGRSPTADGQPLGTLANWTVGAYQTNPKAPTMVERDWLDAAHRESLIDNAVGPGGAMSLRFGVGTGGTEPTAPAIGATARGTDGGPASSLGAPSAFIGALDFDLVGRPVARKDGISHVGPIPAEGRLLLVTAARERITDPSLTSGGVDDGLIRSPDGMLEDQRRELTEVPATDPRTPKLVEFPNGRRAPSITDGIQGDAEALDRMENDRLAAASATLVRWLFGSPSRSGGDQPGLDPTDPRALAGILAEETPRDDAMTDDRAEGGINRAGLGVPIGVIVGAALAYRLHRRPPRWWLRRGPIDQIDGVPRHQAVPRGPRYMVPPRPVFRRRAASRKIIHH